jgi:outer membrane protein assembly factor BamB
MADERSGLSRRQYLALSAVAGVAGAAGCPALGGTDDGDANTDGEPNDGGASADGASSGPAPTPTATPTASATPTPTPTPTATPVARGDVVQSAFYDAGNTGSSAEATGVGGDPATGWQTEFGGGSYQPTVADGRVFFALHAWSLDEPNAFALDLSTGEKQWAYDLGGATAGPPAVVDGRAYFLAGHGEIHVLEAATGNVAWTGSIDTDGEYAPLVHDGILVAPGDSRTVALDATTGEELWSFRAGRGAAAAPAAAGDTVHVVTYPGDSVPRYVTALALETGDVRWQVESPYAYLTAPVVDGDRVYVANKNEGVAALDPATGEQLWTTAARPTEDGMAPAVADGTLFVADGWTLSAIGPDGTERWEQEFDQSVTTAPTVVDGTVYVGRHEYVTALDAADGTERWSRSLGDGVTEPPTVAGARVVAATGDHTGGNPETVYTLR